MTKKIRLSLDLTPDFKAILEKLADTGGTDQGEVIRRAILVFKAIKEGEKNGEFPALVKDGKIVARLVGF